MAEKSRVSKATAEGPAEVLARKLEEVMTLNKDPALASKIRHCHTMVTTLNSYLEDTCSPQSALQEKIWNDHFNEPWDDNFEKGLTTFNCPLAMISGKYEGQFLQMIAELNKSKRILEIGLLSGYSAAAFAQSPHCEEVVALELNQYMGDFTKARFAGTPIENKLRIIIGSASDSLVTLKKEGKKFDLVFIDADKGGYIGYYKYIMDNDLLEKDGVMLCDNVLWSSDPYLEQVRQGGKELYEFVKFVKSDERVKQVIIPIRDGVLMIKHNIQ